jgi:ADP-ribose pyrophosphatase YjhB (NUDIX family)
MALFQDDMVVDPALQAEITARAIAGAFGDEPDRAVHDLGDIALPGGGTRRVFLRHAADAIFVDDHGQTVLITRLHSPGRGKQAIPGGFIDEVAGRVETSQEAAWREVMEETGVSMERLSKARITPLGPRRYNRPFDIRAAWSNLAGTEIRQGDLFLVSTRGFRFRVAGNLAGFGLQAGDDAGAVAVLKIAALTPEQFAVPDHLAMIQEAAAQGDDA